MRRPRLFWPSIVTLCIAAAVMLGGGVTRGTFALYNGETQNKDSTFAAGWIGAPTLTSVAASGNNVNLAWTPGTHGPVTGQEIWGADMNTTASCTGATYALLTSTSAATATLADARGTASNGGHWFCYKIISKSATAWTAEAAYAPLQLGLAASAVSESNGATRCSFLSPTPATGRIDCNDKIVLTFNQQPVAPPTTVAVCVFSTSKTIVLGDTNTTKCQTSTAPNSIGTLVTTGSIGANASYTSSSVVTSTVAPWTITITLASNNGSPPTVSGTFTYTPSTTVKSVGTPQASVCTTAATICKPSAASGF